MSIDIQVQGLDELIRKMDQYPETLDAGLNQAMETTLLVMAEHVPGYPPKPEGSRYRRTGTLGRTLGSSMEGKAQGQAEIYSVKQLGRGEWEGRFGTRLSYAPYVIGDNTQSKVHEKRWWTLASVAARAQAKIERIWQELARQMSRFMEDK